MTSQEHSRYRGYKIRLQRQWSSWCAGIYPTRADLPLLARSILDTLARQESIKLLRVLRRLSTAL